MTRRPLLALAAVLVIGGGAGFWFFTQHSGGPAPLLLQGNVDVRQAELAFKVPGRIGRMAVEEGDAVKAGQLLAELERQDFEADLRQAEAQVATQTANLTELLNGSRPEEIDQARAQVADGQATLINAQLTFLRQQQLLKSDVTSRSNYEQAEAALHQAEARLAAAKATLTLMVKGPRVERIEAARAQLEQGKANLALIRQRLADTTLSAPDDGVVLARAREPGTIVAAGEPVYSVVFTHPTWIRAYVAEPSLGRVRPGMPAEITTDGARRYRGQVGYVSPLAEFTPKTVQTPEQRAELVYRLRVVVTDADAGLRQGMPVTVRLIEDAEGGTAASVPAPAPRSAGR